MTSPLTDDPNWWRGAVIYQIYPRSFQDSTGDGIGDIPGITARLQHIADLGADAIWVSPVFRSPMKDMGYDVSDYIDIDPMFGTLADFDAMVTRAHDLGLRVMIDQVLSHTADTHDWFKQSRADRTNPKANWYVWADPQPDGTAPNNWLSVFGGPAWEWDGVRKQYYLHNFLASQPDLNFHEPEVRAALLDTVRFWLDRGVDGFRLDTANFYFHDAQLRSNPPVDLAGVSGGIGADAPDVNPYGMQSHLYSKSRPENIGFLEEFRALLDAYPNTTAVGEVGDARAIELTAEYTATGKRLHMAYTFDLLSPTFGAQHMNDTVARFETAVTDGWVCWALSNHDVVRHTTRWATARRDPAILAKFGASLLLSLRGSVCLYQGEELGLTEADIAFEDLQDPYGIRFWPAFKGRDGCRTPMVWDKDAPAAGFSTGTPWLPVPGVHLPQAVGVQQSDPDSVLAHYRAALRFRAAHPALRAGSFENASVVGDIWRFERVEGNTRLCCGFNFGDTPAEFPSPGQPIADAPGATGAAPDGTVILPPLGFAIGRLD